MSTNSDAPSPPAALVQKSEGWFDRNKATLDSISDIKHELRAYTIQYQQLTREMQQIDTQVKKLLEQKRYHESKLVD